MPWVRCILLHKNKPHHMQDNLEGIDNELFGMIESAQSLYSVHL